MDPSIAVGRRVLLTVVIALATLPLAWRRRAPVAVLAVVIGAVGVGVAASSSSDQGQGPFSVFLAVLVAVFSFGAYARQRLQIVIGVAFLSAGFAAEVLHDRFTDARTDFGFWMAVAVFWGLGRLFGERLFRLVGLEQRAEQLEQDREANARAAVADERARIARELHDVVAHSVSVMVIQAGAALHTLKADDVDTAEALGSIETTGRQALVELRHLLGILRHADDEPALAPMPGLAQVTVLSEQIREAGLPVEVRVEGQPSSAAPRHRSGRLPHRAGGTDQQPEARRRGTCMRHHPLRGARARPGDPRRWSARRAEGRRHRPRAGGYARACFALRRGTRRRTQRRRRVCCPRPAALERGLAMTLRIVIADDQQLVRAGFRRILEAEAGIEVVAEAGDGFEAIAAVHQHHPDVVLMDIRMPQLDGLEATRRLLHDDPHLTRVLVLTTFDLDDYVYEALHAGRERLLAQGLAPQRARRSRPHRRRRRCPPAPSITRKVVAEFARRTPQPTPPPTALGVLTPRELDVLTLLAHGRSNAQIASDLVISDATAKTHVAHVLMKLDLADRVHAVITRTNQA